MLLDGVDPGLSDLRVLRRQHARDANGADDLALENNGEAAFQRHDVLQGQKAQARCAMSMAES